MVVSTEKHTGWGLRGEQGKLTQVDHGALGGLSGDKAVAAQGRVLGVRVKDVAIIASVHAKPAISTLAIDI